MSELLIQLLTAAGLCYGMQYKMPWPNIRLLREMAKCSYCTGFWAGMMACLLHGGMDMLPDLAAPMGTMMELGMDLLSMGLASAMFCHVLDEGVRRMKR